MSRIMAAWHARTWACVAALISAAVLTSAQESSRLFLNESQRSEIYHDGWIDLNKNGTKDPYEDPSAEVERRLDDLIARMTLDEKTVQMATLYGYPRVLKDELPTEAWLTALWKDGIGNIDEQLNGNVGAENPLPVSEYRMPHSRHARALNEIQRFFVEKTRLGVPVDFTNEGIRGLLHTKTTSFPSELGVGTTWNSSLALEIGRITGREARALGYTNVYSPVLDLNRDPRWGRVAESYSEDPFLTGEFGANQVRGIQEQRVVSTLKHFAVYGVPNGGRDGPARTDPQVPWREVQTLHLHPFRKAIAAGALGVMASYNDYDGIPIEANPRFLTDLLRRELGFRGYVVSDSAAVEFIHEKHRVAATYADAVREAVQAGLNVRTNFSMPEVYVTPLRQNVREGKLAIETIDSRVRDILRVKLWLGLFDRPYVADPDAADKIVRAPEHLAVAKKVAREAVILLKNENNALPLRKELKSVLVTGPLADDQRAWWDRYGPQEIHYITVLDGIRRKLGPKVDVRYQKGVDVADADFPASDVDKDPPSDAVKKGIAAAVSAARGVDAAIVVLGETDELSRESVSRINLNLPGYQEELLRAIHATGVPVVLVLSNGRPQTVNWAARHVPAIVEAWFPGEDGGDAIADVLFGDYNPAGRLSVTIPRSVGQIPYAFPSKPRALAADRGQVAGPLYPFGFGLSYTSFTYTNLKVTPDRIGQQGRVEVAVDVTNSGTRAGDEVVQLYLRDDYSSVTTFEKNLRGFARVPLKAGETQAVRFTLLPEHLALYDRQNEWTVEPGRFTVMIGASSEDIRLRGSFTVTRPDGTAPEEAPFDSRAPQLAQGSPERSRRAPIKGEPGVGEQVRAAPRLQPPASTPTRD